MGASSHPAPIAWDTGALPSGVRVYCIGDVHGRYDLLCELRSKIEADLRRRPVAQPLTVLLGDYIDRGPDSCHVIDLLAARDFPCELITLRGNHEQMLLDFLGRPETMEHWRRFGGLETLMSYNIALRGVARGKDFDEVHADLAAGLPEPHLAFLESTGASVTIGNYFFCHAGVRPGVDLEQQSVEDLLWIREPFLSHALPFGKIVVHGHTPVETIDARTNRINIDTGAYLTDNLTCLVLEDETINVLRWHRAIHPTA